MTNNINSFFIGVHDLIDKNSDLFIGIKEPLFYPSGECISDEERIVIDQIKNIPGSEKLLQKLCKNAMGYLMFDVFCLMDGVIDLPQSQELRLGFSLVNSEDFQGEKYEMYHDVFVSTLIKGDKDDS